MQEKENSEFKPVKLRLNNDLVLYAARAEGLGKYDILTQIVSLDGEQFFVKFLS